MDYHNTVAAHTPDGFVIRRLMPGFSIHRGKSLVRAFVASWSEAVATVLTERQERKYFGDNTKWAD